jgi:hypothetical protein
MKVSGIRSLPTNPFENSNLLMEVASKALLEVGLVDISKAWFFGSAINLLSPSPMMIPYVQSLKKNSFYFTDGISPFDKLINFLKNEDNLLFTMIIVPSIIITCMFFIVQISGMFFLIKKYSDRNRLTISYVLAIVGYYLIITGPIIGVKYRLPIEPILILFSSYSFYLLVNRFSSNKKNSLSLK